MTLATGSRVGWFEIESSLGAGGMGEVYKAKDTRLERLVALKVLPEEFFENEERTARFKREAKTLAALNHPNIAGIFTFEEVSGRHILVMELVEGDGLDVKIGAGALSFEESLSIVRQIAEALAAAHEKGIVHRDLKPANVKVTSTGHVKVLDFGLARRLPEDSPTGISDSSVTVSRHTEPGTVLGTVAYMSPEQVRGVPADARSDVFALGIVLLEMLTGRRPFRCESEAETMAAILREEPEGLSDVRRTLPPAAARLLARCLEKKPEKRFQSARDLALDLEALLAEGNVPAGAPAAASPSIAVLPLADLSPERDQEYFCDGLAEELLNALTKIHGLKVASRTSSFQFKGSTADIAEIGRRLRVATILEGSSRKSGDRLRITVQLINVADGYHLWSGRFDRELKDVFAVQEEIATSVADALRLALTEPERRALGQAPTDAFEAYDYYLRGRQFFYRFGVGDLKFARELYEKAIEIDPRFAAAHAGLADCCSWAYLWYGSRTEDLRQAVESSARAVTLDPESAPAHASRGLALSLERRYEEAEREFHEAMRLDPRLFEASYFLGRMRVSQGRLAEAAEHFERSFAVRPEDYQAPLLLGWIYRKLEREEERVRALGAGLDAARRHLERNPEDARALYMTANALIELGQRAEGLDLLDRVMARHPEDQAVLYNSACAFALAGEKDRAIDCLEKALAGGWGNREWIEHDADLDPLRDHPRFRNLFS